MLDQKTPRILRLAAATMLWLGVTACDQATPDDDVVDRALPCNLADEACAALPAAADAVVLLESLDVDVDEADVELVDELSEPEAAEPADEPRSIDALTSETPPPVAQRWTCNGGDGVMCCCLWDGPEWGCYCN